MSPEERDAHAAAYAKFSKHSWLANSPRKLQQNLTAEQLEALSKVDRALLAGAVIIEDNLPSLHDILSKPMPAKTSTPSDSKDNEKDSLNDN